MPRSPSLTTLRSAVVTAIQNAMNSQNPGQVNTVNDRVVFWRDKAYFESLFKRADNASSGTGLGWKGLMNGWALTITSKEREAKEWFRYYILYRVEMDGYLAIQQQQYSTAGKTQKDFLDQIDNIKDLIRMNTAIFNNTEESTPVSQLEQLDVVDIAEYRAWHARLTLECEAIDTRFS